MIYLDNAATTRPDPAVLEAMARAQSDYGNAASVHRLGVAAAKAVEKARAAVAETLAARAFLLVVVTKLREHPVAGAVR